MRHGSQASCSCLPGPAGKGIIAPHTFGLVSHLLIFCLIILTVTATASLADAAPPTLPAIGKKPEKAAPPPANVETLTDDEINQVQAQIDARLAELRRQLLPNSVEAVRSTYRTVANATELAEWENLMARLVMTLESHANTLARIKAVRKKNRDRADEITGWQGFAEKPPYGISLLDSLNDAIRAKQINQQSMDMMRNSSEAEIEDLAESLKRTRKEVRLAEESVERNAGKAKEERSKWLLTVARLKEDLYQAGTVNAEARLTLVKESLDGNRKETEFLMRKRTIVRENYRFTEEELARKLQEIDGRRERLRQEIEQAVRDGERWRKQLDAVESTLRKGQADLAAGKSGAPVDRLQKELERVQTLFDSADSRAQILRGMNRLLRQEKDIWKQRYQVVSGQDVSEVGSSTELKSIRDALTAFGNFANSQLARLQFLIKSQEDKLNSPPLSDAEAGDLRSILAAYREQEALIRRSILLINEFEQLSTSLKEEIKSRADVVTLTGRIRGAYALVAALTKKVWFTELYVAEETIIVEGKKIVRPRSVTVGKLMVALGILLAGSWVIGYLKKLFRWFATKLLKVGPNDALLYGRLLSYVLFIGVLVSALISVNIPLAFFAFFGGALAIGVGFGAQNLINNFISGLILMFDRTIRLGDMVEVDGHRGRVAAIGMRNSSIKRFDGVEMLVPNSLFLQQNVINWTSSDRRARYTVSVGVAYGTSTRETEQVILKAVEDQREVLRDPPPYVIFDNFAESSLIFTAYFWIDLDPEINSLEIFSNIRHCIGERLAEAGIEIPFPQRDLHMEADRPIEIRLLREE